MSNVTTMPTSVLGHIVCLTKKEELLQEKLQKEKELWDRYRQNMMANKNNKKDNHGS